MPRAASEFFCRAEKKVIPKTPNSKSQIPRIKSQGHHMVTTFAIWSFEFFGIWCLGFGISFALSSPQSTTPSPLYDRGQCLALEGRALAFHPPGTCNDGGHGSREPESATRHRVAVSSDARLRPYH